MNKLELYIKDKERLKALRYATFEAWFTVKDRMIEEGLEINRLTFLKASKGMNRKQKKALALKYEQANSKVVSKIELEGKKLLPFVEETDRKSEKKQAHHLTDGILLGFDRAYAKKNKK